MRSFRFPRWMIFWMLMGLSGLIFAIDKGRSLSIKLASGASVPSSWWALLACFIAVFAFMCVAAGIGYALMFALRRAGIQRFSSIQSWRTGR